MNKETLDRTIRQINELSTLPEIYSKMSEIINDPRSSANMLAGVISRDPVLTAKILRVANSPFYRASSIRITSITHAVVILGFKAVAHLAMTASIFELFSRYRSEFKNIVRGIWRHSLTCASGARIIGEFINHKDPEELFVAGLLHDIGKIVELQFMPQEFEQVLKMIKSSDMPIGDAEEQIIGFRHTYIGSLLCKQWKLSPQIIASIEEHNTPDKTGNFQTHVSITHLADVFSYVLSMGDGGSEKVPVLSHNAWNSIALGTNSIDLILSRINKESKDAMDFFFSQD